LRGSIVPIVRHSSRPCPADSGAIGPIDANERWGVERLDCVGIDRAVEQLTRFSTPNGSVRYPARSPRNDRIVFEHATVTANIWAGRLTGESVHGQ
jgi:hypothetical protein